MGGILFKLIGILLVVGVIFGFGVLVGGGFATGAAEESMREQIVQCLPIENAEELTVCLAEGDRQ